MGVINALRLDLDLHKAAISLAWVLTDRPLDECQMRCIASGRCGYSTGKRTLPEISYGGWFGSEESIAVALMSSFHTPGLFGSELDAP